MIYALSTHVERYCDSKHCCFMVGQRNWSIWIGRVFNHLHDDLGEFVSHPYVADVGTIRLGRCPIHYKNDSRNVESQGPMNQS